MTRAELRALCEAATPGPWRVDGDYVLCSEDDGDSPPEPGRVARVNITTPLTSTEDDAAFIAAARTELPALLDQLDATDAQAAALKDALVYAEERYTNAEAELKHANANLVMIRQYSEKISDELDVAEARIAELEEAAKKK